MNVKRGSWAHLHRGFKRGRRVRVADGAWRACPSRTERVQLSSPTDCHWRLTALHLAVHGLPQTIWRPAESVAACTAAAVDSGWGGCMRWPWQLHHSQKRSCSANLLFPNCRAPRELHRVVIPRHTWLTAPNSSRAHPSPAPPRTPPSHLTTTAPGPSLLPPPQHV